MPTKRMFDLGVMLIIGVHLVVSNLARPWARMKLNTTTSPVGRVAAEVALRAA